MANIEAIKQKFMQEHPDVDIKELITFFTNELPARVQEEIKAQPIDQFFNLVYELYTQHNAPQEEPPQDEPLPSQAEGVPVSSDASDTNSSHLPMSRN